MKRRDVFLGVVAVCGFAASGAAQIPSQGERYRIDTSGAAEGQPVVTITNVSAVPLTAFRAVYRCPTVTSFVEDTVIVGMGTPQPEKKTLTFALPQKECSGGVTVLVFSDSQHPGDADAWKQVVVQRSAAYSEVSGLLSAAEGMNAKQWTLSEFLAEVGKRRAVVAADKTMPVDERRGRLMALDVAQEGFGLQKPAAARTTTIKKLIQWMSALGDSVGNERVGFSPH